MSNLCKEAALGPVRDIHFEDIEMRLSMLMMYGLSILMISSELLSKFVPVLTLLALMLIGSGTKNLVVGKLIIFSINA